MTTAEAKAYIKNIYAACTQMQTAGDIPAGEAVQVARIVLAALMERDTVDIPRV